MKNVTITLDPEVARWARMRAAELDTSVSRMLGDMLRDAMHRESEYEKARASFLARQPVAMSAGTMQYPTRQELHDRASLR